MRHHKRLSILIAGLLVPALMLAQTSTSSRSKTTTQPQTVPEPKKSKIDKQLEETNRNIDNTSSTMDNAGETTEKAKNTFDKISKVFKPKTANEALIIIPDIEFEDENLDKLLEAVKDNKAVKKATLDYTDGVATINVSLKSKASTDFWNDLPKDIKAYFKMRNKKESSILVAYQKNTQSANP